MDEVDNNFNLTLITNNSSLNSFVQLDGGLYLQTSINGSIGGITEDLEVELPLYIRLTVSLMLLIILVVGTIGNTMVIIVICCSRDMRTSTNFFLVNLSVADLLVLMVLTPPALIEALYDPEEWLFGKTMCYIVVPLEMTVCHASVLTILAISFERYLVICTPLKANYVCTRARAVWICALVWILAIIITSPMFLMTSYHDVPDIPKPMCVVSAGTFWPDLYTVSSTIFFFFLPLLLMIVTYALIAHKLCPGSNRGPSSSLVVLNNTCKAESARGRKQVVIMLGAVVFTFFLCLLPFRILTLLAVFSDYGSNWTGRTEIDFAILFLVRIMAYANSALNAILYSVCSSKFRNGFLNLCGRRKKQYIFHRNGTFVTLSTTLSQHNILNNNVNQCITGGNVTTALAQQNFSTPSTSPELLLTSNLVRSNTKNCQNMTNNKKFYQRNGTGASKNIVAGGKSIDPKKLSKKFLYSYVSGHKTESML